MWNGAIQVHVWGQQQKFKRMFNFLLMFKRKLIIHQFNCRAVTLSGQEGGGGEPWSQPCLLPPTPPAPQCHKQHTWQVKALLLPNPQIFVQGSKVALRYHQIQLPVSACAASALFILSCRAKCRGSGWADVRLCPQWISVVSFSGNHQAETLRVS